MSIQNTMRSPKALLWTFIPIAALARLLQTPVLKISPDEAYYWTWSRRLAVCYYDQPGMVAWVDWLFALPFDRTTEFTLRLPAVLLTALTTWILYRLYLEYRKDEEEAVVFAVMFSLLPFAWLVGIMMIHDTTLFPWMALSFWMIVRLANHDGRAKDWFFLAIALTGAMYAKFSAFMIVWGLVLYMILSPKGRRWWKTWPPYAAGLLSAVLYSPVIIWNMQNDWISVHAVRELTDVSEVTVLDRARYFTEYVLSQIGMFSVVLGIVAFAALIKGARDAWKDPLDDEALLPVCLALPIFLYFLVNSLKSHVYGNWPGVAYIPLGMIAMKEAAASFRFGRTEGIFGTKLVKAGVIVNLVVLILGTLVIHGAFRPVFGYIEETFDAEDRIDWRMDLDLRGWEAMADLVEEARPRADFIMARRYQVASLLEWELPDRPFVECYNTGQRGNQWDLWSTLPEKKGQTALFVDYKRLPEEVEGSFREMEPVVAPFVLGDPKRPVKKWYIYLGKDFSGPEKSNSQK